MIVWIASYPRSGNTFLRVMLNQIFSLPTYSIHGDQEDIASDPATANAVGHQALPDDFSIAAARSSTELYLIKTHEPPPNTADKAIYLIRNGLSSLISYAHYICDYRPDTDYSSALRNILDGRESYGTWSEHLANWDPQNRPNTLTLRFEELVENPNDKVDVLADFLNVEPVKPEIPAFEDLQKVNARMFRKGSSIPNKQDLPESEETRFWIRNYQTMRTLGYENFAPEIFRDDLTRAILSQVDYSLRSIQNLNKEEDTLRALAPEVIADLVDLVNTKTEDAILAGEAAEESRRLLEESESASKWAQEKQTLLEENSELRTKMADLKKSMTIIQGQADWLRQSVTDMTGDLSASVRQNSILVERVQAKDRENRGIQQELEPLRERHSTLLELVRNVARQPIGRKPRSKLQAYRTLLTHVLSDQ